MHAPKPLPPVRARSHGGRTAAALAAGAVLLGSGWFAAGAVPGLTDASLSTTELASRTESGANESLPTALWPDTMTATEFPWKHFEMTLGATSSDGPTMEFAHDTRTGRSRIVTHGEPVEIDEISDGRVMQRVANGEWRELSTDEAESRRSRLAFADPVHVHDLFDARTEPFVRITETDVVAAAEPGELGSGVTRYAVEFDGDAYGANEPLARAQWTLRQNFMVEQPRHSWTLDVRDDGYVVRWLDSVPGAVMTWHRAAEPVELESPLAR